MLISVRENMESALPVGALGKMPAYESTKSDSPPQFWNTTRGAQRRDDRQAGAGPGRCGQLFAATINPSDYGMIGGSYGLADPPAVAGREGVGEVDALAGVFNVGWVRVCVSGSGTWQEYARIPA